MNNQEVKIISKIIRELSHYVMIHGYKNYTLETRIEEKVTYFKLSIQNPSKAMLEKMKEKVSRERELEVETYGWELIGDIDEKTELEILGLLIDEMVIEKKEDMTHITLIRESRYKE